MSANLIADLRASTSAHAISDAALHEARNKLATMRADLQAKRQRCADERETQYRDAAVRALDGPDAAPLNEARRLEIAQLDDEIPALEAAIKLQEDRIRDAERQEAAARKALAGPTLQLVYASQSGAADKIIDTLAELAPAFAELIASDQIRQALIGDRYAVPDGSPAPFHGLRVARNIIKAIPDRLQPAELAESLLFEAAHEISTKILADIQGGQS